MGPGRSICRRLFRKPRARPRVRDPGGGGGAPARGARPGVPLHWRRGLDGRPAGRGAAARHRQSGLSALSTRGAPAREPGPAGCPPGGAAPRDGGPDRPEQVLWDCRGGSADAFCRRPRRGDCGACGCRRGGSCSCPRRRRGVGAGHPAGCATIRGCASVWAAMPGGCARSASRAGRRCSAGSRFWWRPAKGRSGFGPAAAVGATARSGSD